METKRTHFKMYKSGRKWVFACALVLAMGGTATVAHADAGNESDNASGAKQEVVKESDSSTTQDSSAASTKTTTDEQPAGDSVDEDANAAGQSTKGSSNDTDGNPEATKGSETQDPAAAKQDSNSEAANQNNGIKAASLPLPANSDKADGTDQPVDADKNSATKATQEIDAYGAQTTTLNPTEEALVQNGGSVYDDFPTADQDNILGVSSYFHIFANEAELSTHTNGNVAVGKLTGQVNFGTNIIEGLLDKDITYIQSFDKLANSSFVVSDGNRVNKVIFGEDISIDLSNPSRPQINGIDFDHLTDSEVYQDKDGNVYIDFAKEFAKLKQTNKEVADWPSVADYTNASWDDQNNRVIDVTDMVPDENGRIVINLSPEVLNSDTPLTIKGLDPDEQGHTVVINVDTGGQSDYNMKSQIKIIYSDGASREPQETEYFGDNHLLWNFIDRSAEDKQFNGNINMDNVFMGSVLAPSADITINHNLDGNIVANRVHVKGGETHRWDLQDRPTEKPQIQEPEPNPEPEPEPEPEPDPEPETPEPETPEPETPEPETPEPETPEPEKPGTEEPNIEEPGEEEELDEEFGHHHPDEDIIDEFEEEFEEAETPAEEEALLQRVDAAIVQAQAQHDTALVAQLEVIRTELLQELGRPTGTTGTAAGLPQTSEHHSNLVQVLGLALAATTLGGWFLRKRP